MLKFLALREVSPTVKRPQRQLWGEAASGIIKSAGPRLQATSAKLALISWSVFGFFNLQISGSCVTCKTF